MLSSTCCLACEFYTVNPPCSMGGNHCNKKTAESCEARGFYPGDQAIIPSAFEFRHERIGIVVGHRYLAINRATSNVVPVTIESKYQSAYNKHETHYTAVKDNGQPLNLNGWYLVDLSEWVQDETK